MLSDATPFFGTFRNNFPFTTECSPGNNVCLQLYVMMIDDWTRLLCIYCICYMAKIIKMLG